MLSDETSSSNLNACNDSQLDSHSNSLARLENLKVPSEAPSESTLENVKNSRFDTLNVEREPDPNYDPFEGVDSNDPFFGLIPKLLRSIVSNDSIPLKEILAKNGVHMGIFVLLYSYPVSTLLALKRTDSEKTNEELQNELDETKSRLAKVELDNASLESRVTKMESGLNEVTEKKV